MTTPALTIALLMSIPLAPLSPGEHERQIQVGELQRSYLLYLPKEQPAPFPKGPSAPPPPVVLIFHGGGSNARQMMTSSGMNQKANSAGFVAVYPNGAGRIEKVRTFNAGICCGYAARWKIDDVAFVRQLLDDLKTVVAYDARRVYATGMSNGGMICYRLADELADRIAAIAPVAGTMGKETCSPSRPVPVCHIHGANDAFVRYEGGAGKRSLSRTNFFSVDHTIQAWRKANGCREKPRVMELPIKVDDGTKVTKIIYSGKAEIVLYRIEGGGHTWPGRDSGFKFLGPVTANLSANDAVWEFFKRHRLDERRK